MTVRAPARIYLAARYSRRVELCAYREQLEAMGHTVTSRWLNGRHQIGEDGRPIGDEGEALVEHDGSGGSESRSIRMRQRLLREDLEDVSRAQIVISFTEPPRSAASRGGRHVEFGFALAQCKVQVVVGYRENLFHYEPSVAFFPTWFEARQSMEDL